MNKMKRVIVAAAVGTVALGAWGGPAHADDGDSNETNIGVSPDTNVSPDVGNGNATGLLNGDNGSGNNLSDLVGDIL